MRLSPRALAPVLTLVILGGIVASFMVYRTLPSGAESSFDASAPRPKPAQAQKPAAKPKKAPPANKAKVTPAKQAKPKVRAAAPKPAAAPATVRTPAPAPVPAATKPKTDPVDENGLPLVLSRALARNPVTVVALYDPSAALDKMTLAEARAGAAAANAGFLAISIRNEAQVRPLAQLLGALGSPSVLVYERPDTLFFRLEGFADRDTVAQAAANARR
jgi:outer membrane biosynthesis protein TonB